MSSFKMEPVLVYQDEVRLTLTSRTMDGDTVGHLCECMAAGENPIFSIRQIDGCMELWSITKSGSAVLGAIDAFPASMLLDDRLQVTPVVEKVFVHHTTISSAMPRGHLVRAMDAADFVDLMSDEEYASLRKLLRGSFREKAYEVSILMRVNGIQ